MLPAFRWNNIRNCCIAPKVKIFFWFLCHDALPAAHTLFDSDIIGTAECGLCHAHNGTISHIFLECLQFQPIRNTFTLCFDAIHRLNPSNFDAIRRLNPDGFHFTSHPMKKIYLDSVRLYLDHGKFEGKEKKNVQNYLKMDFSKAF